MVRPLQKTLALSLLCVLSIAACSKSATSAERQAARESPTGIRAADGSIKFFGNKVSLRLTEVEISEVLTRLASAGGINIVVSSRVTGKTSVRFKNIPWDQAMREVLEANALGILSSNAPNFYRIDTAEIIAVEREKYATHPGTLGIDR